MLFADLPSGRWMRARRRWRHVGQRLHLHLDGLGTEHRRQPALSDGNGRDSRALATSNGQRRRCCRAAVRHAEAHAGRRRRGEPAKLTVRVRDQTSRGRASAPPTAPPRTDASSVRSNCSAYADIARAEFGRSRPAASAAAASADDTPATLGEGARARARARRARRRAASLGRHAKGDGGSARRRRVRASAVYSARRAAGLVEELLGSFADAPPRERASRWQALSTRGGRRPADARHRFRVAGAGGAPGSFRSGIRARNQRRAPRSRSSAMSTAVTRSRRASWDAAPTARSRPAPLPLRRRPARHERVVLASDGVWDFVTPVQAAKIQHTPWRARLRRRCSASPPTARHAKFGPCAQGRRLGRRRRPQPVTGGARRREAARKGWPAMPSGRSAIRRLSSALSSDVAIVVGLDQRAVARRPPRRVRALSGSHYVCRPGSSGGSPRALARAGCRRARSARRPRAAGARTEAARHSRRAATTPLSGGASLGDAHARQRTRARRHQGAAVRPSRCGDASSALRCGGVRPARLQRRHDHECARRRARRERACARGAATSRGGVARPKREGRAAALCGDSLHSASACVSNGWTPPNGASVSANAVPRTKPAPRRHVARLSGVAPR